MTTGDEMSAERREIEQLLPWHAAGTLNPRDAERVEAAIANDAELARRFELAREELAETVHLNETLGAPSSRAVRKVFAAIDAEARNPRVSFDLAARVSEFFASLSPRVLAWSAAVAALVIVAQAGAITVVLLKNRGSTVVYETASANGPRQTQASRQGSEVLVRFAPQASAADITKFLKTYNASVVEGPTGDLYRLRIGVSKNDIGGIVKAMQSERDVVALVLPGSNQ
jgi:anti-sigma-K factor RskA